MVDDLDQDRVLEMPKVLTFLALEGEVEVGQCSQLLLLNSIDDGRAQDSLAGPG